MKFKKIITVIFMGTAIVSCSNIEDNIFSPNNTTTFDKNYESQIDELLDSMTLDEKLGQLNLLDSGDITTGEGANSNVAKLIEEGKVGGILNLTSAEKINKAQKIAVEQSRLHIPLLIGLDVIHGYKTTFPIPLGLSSTWNIDLIEKTARIAATEASADGINWVYSPMVDISRDPRWGRVAEGSGEDPYLGSLIAKAMVRGYQDNDLSLNNTVMACFKHFALYGAVEAGRDYNTVDMSKVRMYNEYFPPYKAAVEAGAGSVMAAFNDINGVPATEDKWLLTDVLRKEWGFNGFVVTDYTAIPEMVNHGVGTDLQDVSALALKAGVDMDMVGQGFIKTLKKSLKEEKISIDDINLAVKRILQAKFELGLFKDPYKYSNDKNRAEKEIFTKDNRTFARQVGSESAVLLKNQNNLLPLAKKGTIAIIGPLGNNSVNMAGTWSVSTDQYKSISLLDGVREVIGDKAKVLYSKGSNLSYDEEFEKNVTMFNKPIPRDNRTDKQLLDEAVKIAEKSDVIIAALGESAEMSGESTSRVDIEIPKAQKDLLKALLQTGKPVVLVLFTGRPLVLVDEATTVPAILNVWFPGSEAGLSIADVLFGDVNPSGKLTMSWPRDVGQIPIYYNHKNTGRPLSKDDGKFEKFHSNYLDVPNDPLYPFGYGLSYTTFKISKPELSKNSIGPNDKLVITTEVTNTGNYNGAEVVQLYIHQKVRSITPPVKELKGFKKIFLKKGETKTVKFVISPEDLKFYNNDLEFVYEPGEFELFVSDSSDHKFTNTFSLTKEEDN
ncbi:beta-glucosidase BglX [Francisella frigiditurris]|uniref:Periplasmic beta-glucosidase n=1 Tax=Francisella frigiditurris TaxID=1542390 RepID=A0A1J0KSY9_9GAMM|nr:beta-glucosidase BglX [Francisella frigiditurris]APC96766.1 hypothetical protein KX01_1241 [Francisella frigiditurris]